MAKWQSTLSRRSAPDWPQWTAGPLRELCRDAISRFELADRYSDTYLAAILKRTSIRLPMLSLTIEEMQIPPVSASGSRRAAILTRAVPKVTAMRQTKERRKTYLSASRHDEAPIIHVQPIAPTNKLVLGVPREWAIGFRAKIGFVKSGHERQLHKRPNQAHF